MRILGLDPSLSSTGWGIIEVENNRVKYIETIANTLSTTNSFSGKPQYLKNSFQQLYAIHIDKAVPNSRNA